MAGLDLFLFDGEIDDLRLADLVEPMTAMISDSRGDEESSEGRDALDFLLCSMLNLDHGIKRSVRELLEAVLGKSDSVDIADPEAALARHGIYVCANKKAVAVRTGPQSPAAMLFSQTKWRKGAHVSALLKISGAEKPTSALRFGRAGQQRVLTVPTSFIFDED